MKLTPGKMIVCIVPKGHAIAVTEALWLEKGIKTANVNFARGIGKITPLAHRGVGEQTEKEILRVMVPADQADSIFKYIYHKAKIYRPHGGLMYMHSLQKATEYTLPELPEEV